MPGTVVQREAEAFDDKYGADDNVTITTSGYTIIANINELAPATDATSYTVTIQYGHGDYQGVVQYKAQPNDRDDREVEIVGRFNTGASSRNFPAQAPVMIRIGNVAAGSGTAEITNPSSHSVKAGSKDNTIRIHFTAAGTMDGGSQCVCAMPTVGGLAGDRRRWG